VGTFTLFFDLSQGLGAPLLGLIVSVTGGERSAFLAASLVGLVGLVLVNTRLRRAVEEGNNPAGPTGPGRSGSRRRDRPAPTPSGRRSP
jgi:hypothetical protein